jgi:hypothetical protein
MTVKEFKKLNNIEGFETGRHLILTSLVFWSHP